jgi:hypothetical protein
MKRQGRIGRAWAGATAVLLAVGLAWGMGAPALAAIPTVATVNAHTSKAAPRRTGPSSASRMSTAKPSNATSTPEADLDLGNWMSQLQPVIGNTPLDGIKMPGSHDAGSWSIRDGSGLCTSGDNYSISADFPAVAASMSRSQSGSIVDQLNAGSRYLDLRLCNQNGLWYTYHGGPMGDLFFDADGQQGEADSIAQWIQAHPDEIVIIQLATAAPSAEASADDAQAVTELAQLIGMNAIATTPQLTPQSTYDQYLSAGKHVVLIDDSNTVQQPWAWAPSVSSDRGSYSDASPTWQQYLEEIVTGSSPQPLFDTTISLDQAALATDPAPYTGTFFVLQGIIEPSVTIPAAVFAQAEAALGLIPASIADNYLLSEEDQLNPQLLQQLQGAWSAPPMSDAMNIVMTDDVDQNTPAMPLGTLQRAVIAINYPDHAMADGTLIRNPVTGAESVVAGGAQIHFLTGAEVDAAGDSGSTFVNISPSYFNAMPTVPADGTLVRGDASAQVWQIESSEKVAATAAPGQPVTVVSQSWIDGLSTL